MSSFIDWCNQLAIGIAIRKSNWLFPIIETIHLIALTVLLGTVVVVALRLFGLVLRAQQIARVAKELSPWTFGAMVTMIVTGALLFVSEPVKCYSNPPFRIKMVLLLLAVIYHFTLYRKWTKEVQGNFSVFSSRIVAIFSLLLWFGVGLAGRAIGFY